ncbi:transketolase family protein [Candidatus Saccharibacteria bacterium]|nr:transketolase family protein [Candidatus Saccharibacteria bacterium]
MSKRALHLSNDIGSADITSEPNRKGFGRGLKAAGEANESVVALCADLTESTQISMFRDSFPDRFIEIGIAEQNLVTVSSGMAAMGKIPFCASYSAFCPGRCWEQIRTTVCLNDQPVKIVGAHAGVSVGPDGATHQMLEDIALMRTLPNMVVIAPADSKEAEKATVAMSEDKRPNYIRLAREATPVFTTDSTPFTIGKAEIFHEGTDVSLIATGTMTYQALHAAQILEKDGISAEVIHCATIKPLDEHTILASAKKTGRVITIEEAQIAGGFGSAVAELLSEKLPTQVHRIGIKDHFGESGKPDELLRAFGLTHTHIAMAVHSMLDERRG